MAQLTQKRIGMSSRRGSSGHVVGRRAMLRVVKQDSTKLERPRRRDFDGRGRLDYQP